MRKSISIVTCIALIFTIIPVSAASFQSSKSGLAEFPPIITEKQKSESKLKKRLSKYDNQTNAIGYENEDGTETVFIYNDDIKYTDTDGKIKDKDINIVPAGLSEQISGYAYEMESSDMKFYFAEKLSQQKGIKVVYKNHEITMQPKIKDVNHLNEDVTQAKRLDKTKLQKFSEKNLLR